MTAIILPEKHPLYQTFQQHAAEARLIFFAGLPGVGKSLLLQQMALIAAAAGRKVHLLQWDGTRGAFESESILARYPEDRGVTHAAIRKAVGLWARRAILDWHRRHPDLAHLLIGEVPLIGNRLVELVQPRTDEAESLLRDRSTRFLIPVPAKSVRAHIEEARQRSRDLPQHEKERQDASPRVLALLWQELHGLAAQLGLADAAPGRAAVPYDPAVYQAVYEQLLVQRHYSVVPIKEILPARGSVYASTGRFPELIASPAEAAAALARVEASYTAEELERAVGEWFLVTGQGASE